MTTAEKLWFILLLAFLSTLSLWALVPLIILSILMQLAIV